MVTLNDQVRNIAVNYNELHLLEVKRQKPQIASYLKLAIDNELMPDDLKFETAGHEIYFLQIQELEKLMAATSPESQGVVGNFIAKLKNHNEQDRLQITPEDVMGFGEVIPQENLQKIQEIINDVPLLSEVMD